MRVTLRPSANLQSSFEHVQKRRTELENIRSMNVKRLRADVQRLARREAEYAKGLFEEIVPIRLTVNEDALARLRDFIPFTVEFGAPEAEKKKGVVEPSEVILEDAAAPKKPSGPASDLP